MHIYWLQRYIILMQKWYVPVDGQSHVLAETTKDYESARYLKITRLMGIIESQVPEFIYFLN